LCKSFAERGPVYAFAANNQGLPIVRKTALVTFSIGQNTFYHLIEFFVGWISTLSNRQQAQTPKVAYADSDVSSV
jgi:hypothetical protein